MRPIKFRGLTKEGKWVYGWYIEDAHGQSFIASTDITSPPILANKVKSLTGSHDIVILGAHSVVPETVGQQVGLKDKNGTEIYEDDIVEIGLGKYVCEYRITNWSGEYRFMVLPHKKWFDGSDAPKKVIGNIHTNPELIEGKNNG